MSLSPSQRCFVYTFSPKTLKFGIVYNWIFFFICIISHLYNVPFASGGLGGDDGAIVSPVGPNGNI